MERRRTDDDELELVLPPLEGGGDEETGIAPTDDEDIDLDTLKDGEDVGLDASTEPDRLFDPSELVGASDAEEGQRWTRDSEADDDLEGTDHELVPGEEDGWTEDNESAEDDEREMESLISFPDCVSEEDGGEEGVDEDRLQRDPGGQDDDTTLPPLDSVKKGKEDSEEDEEDDEEDDEEFGRRLLDEIADKKILDEENGEE